MISTNRICSAVQAVGDGQGGDRKLGRVSKAMDRWRVTVWWPLSVTVIMSTDRRYNSDGWLDDLRLFKEDQLM